MTAQNVRTFEHAGEASERAELPPKKKLKLPAPASLMTYADWKVDRLSPHPLQGEMPTTTAAEDESLCEDIQRNGMREPLEVLPDGTLLSGHRRWSVAKRLGLATVGVVVRHDLAAQGEAAIERRFLEANLHRRQLSRLQRLRILRRLVEIWPKGRARIGAGTLRDEIGKSLGLSGRTYERWAKLLDAPSAIGDAVEAGSLSLAAAVRFIDVASAEEQASAAERILAGEDAKAVIAELLPLKKSAKPTPQQVRNRFSRWLESGEKLTREISKQKPGADQKSVDEIRRLIAVLQGLVNSKRLPTEAVAKGPRKPGNPKPR